MGRKVVPHIYIEKRGTKHYGGIILPDGWVISNGKGYWSNQKAYMMCRRAWERLKATMCDGQCYEHWKPWGRAIAGKNIKKERS